MVIYIQDQHVEIESGSTEITEIFGTIDKILAEKNLELGYLIIDDQPIFEDLHNYLSEHLVEIKKIEVIVKYTKKIVFETINSTEQYLSNAIPQIKTLAEEFYQQPSDYTWSKLVDLFEGLQWIIESVVKIDKIKDLGEIVTHYQIWNEYVQGVSELSPVIPEIESAMVGKDNVLIGDLLLYEVIPNFEKMLASLKFLLGEGEKGNVS